MAKYCSLLLIFLITFLAVSNFFTSARDIAPREISLVKEPDENYYILKKSPVIIVCQAKNAVEIAFTCNGTQIPPSSVELKDVTDIDPDLIQAEIEVTRADLQNHEGQTSFWCECSAIDIDGQVAVTSRKGFVSISQLKNKFATQPMSTTALVGEDVELACGAPEGHPKPEIMWRKDKKRLEVENNPRLLVTDKGSLVIQSVISEDKGMYQCVVRNVAGRRESDEAQLTVTALAESAEPDLVLSEESDSGKKTSGAGKPRATRQSIKTYFTTEPQEKYYVTQEKPLLIDCGVVAADILTFRCNGKRMDRTYQTNTQGLDNAGNRVIQSQLTVTYADVQAFLAEFGDTQNYHCICAAWYQDSGSPNGWGRLDSNVAVGFVHLGYLDKVFQTEPSDVTAGLGSDATLVCEPPKGQPNPWVYWHKDGNRLDPRSSEKYSVNAKGHLVVHNVQYEDAGSYNCLAENSVSSVQSRAGRLTVTAEAVVISTATPSEGAFPTFPAVIPSSPVFLRDFEAEYTLGADGTKTVVCAVVSADQISIDCGGQRLAVEDYELKSEVHRETGKRLLHASTVITTEKVASRPDDYFCQCTAWFLTEQNSWGKITSSKGYIKQSTITSFIGEEFETEPENTDAFFESEAELGCQPPPGNPPPKVFWLKDGVRIDSEADPNYVVDSGTLIIEYVRITDEGEYTCVAENEAGVRRSPPVKFTVLGKPTTEGPTPEEVEAEATTVGTEDTTDDDSDTTTSKSVISVHHPEDNYVTEDDPATLSCAVSGAKALLFACNGEVLKETATTGVHYVDPLSKQTVRENTLTVTKEMVEAHTGSEPYVCHCRAFFQVGPNPKDLNMTESSPAYIYIAHLGDHFAVEPSDTEVTYLQYVELPCQAPSGFPEPTIQWLKDDVVITESERVRIEDSGSLVIDQFEDDDEGSYKCEASNTYYSIQSRAAFVSLTVTAGGNEQVTKSYTRPGGETAEPEPGTVSSERGETLYSGNPYISKDLHSSYYLVKNKPVTIICEAYSVESISFTCGMQTVALQESRIREEESSLPDGTANLIKVVEATINVSKTEVENYEAGKDYWCQCHAHYRVPGIEQFQKLDSVKGYVEMAYLKKNFQKEPENQVVMEGDALSIQCQPPVGNPPPKVTWTKDGESIEALSITPDGALIIHEAQLDHAGEYVCVAENDAGKRTSPPIQVEVKGKEGSSSIGKPGKEGNECAQMLSSCYNLLPRNVNQLVLCAAVPDYTACVDNYFEECTGVINEVSMNAVKMAYKDTQKKCTLQQKCPRLEECKVISSNTLDSSLDRSGVSVRELCLDSSVFLNCVDQNLAECNVTMSPPEEDLRPSLLEVSDWFTQYCNRLILNTESLDSCDELNSCDLHITHVTADNATYWCSLFHSLVECTSSAINTCGHDELLNELHELHSQTNEKYCSDDNTNGGPWPEITPEPETSKEVVEPEPTGEANTDGDNGDNENVNTEGGAEASKKDNGNGSAVLETSIILVTLLQLLIVHSLSWR